MRERESERKREKGETGKASLREQVVATQAANTAVRSGHVRRTVAHHN